MSSSDTLRGCLLADFYTLAKELQNSAKGLVNLKNKDNECFRWCLIRHLNPQEKDPQKIESDKKWLSNECFRWCLIRHLNPQEKDPQKNRE